VSIDGALTDTWTLFVLSVVEPRGKKSLTYLHHIAAVLIVSPAISRIEANEGPRDQDGMIAPHAKFFIAKHKNKITIKFYPAV
jgi:hypothetical protein